MVHLPSLPLPLLEWLPVTGLFLFVAYKYWQEENAPREITISELWVYPIKSCYGISLQEAQIDRLGLEMDRRLLVVDEETGKFCTLRQIPRMVGSMP